MNLSVSSTTLRQVVGESNRFPTGLRQLLCSAVEGITVEELPELLAKHESESGNFDSTIESNLRDLDPSLSVRANYRISDRAKFNNDLVIETEGALTCVEIEKGYLARFELDVLKMQAFAARWQHERSDTDVFGAFVVPEDNVVAAHISGNSRESSYQYLKRMCRLVAQIKPLLVEDILLVGYGATPVVDGPPGARKHKGRKPGESIIVGNGLVPDDALHHALRGYPLGLVLRLRKRLAGECPGLREKFNPGSRYLGYAVAGRSDALYVYVQKSKLVLDVRVSMERAGELRQQGFDVRPRDNYQGQAGWLTGVIVPIDADDLEKIVALAREALLGG